MRSVKWLLFILPIATAIGRVDAQEQREVTLPLLYRAIDEQNPISSIKHALDSANRLHIKNINGSYYPKLDFNVSATWQSDVTNIDLDTQDLPFSLDIPSPDRDQYKITIDVSQIIWDGGTTAARKNLAFSQNKVEQGSIVSEVYNLRERVNEAYFAILQIDIGQRRLKLMIEELTARKESLESGIREGVILQSVLNGLQAEMLRLEQRLIEMDAQKTSLINSLTKLTGIMLDANDKFIVPDLPDTTSGSVGTPEIQNFDLRRELIDAQSDLTFRRRMPTLAGFVSTGYGKPGLNMLSNEWNPYILVGAKLSWRIWDWNENNREREQLQIQKGIINLRQMAYEDGQESVLTSTKNQIQMLERQVELDEQVASLLDDVKRRSESQLANGSITSSEYLGDFNAAARAHLDMEMRKVLLAKEKVKLYYILGIDF